MSYDFKGIARELYQDGTYATGLERALRAAYAAGMREAAEHVEQHHCRKHRPTKGCLVVVGRLARDRADAIERGES